MMRSRFNVGDRIRLTVTDPEKYGEYRAGDAGTVTGHWQYAAHCKLTPAQEAVNGRAEVAMDFPTMFPSPVSGKIITANGLIIHDGDAELAI